MENNLNPKVPFLQYEKDGLTFEEATQRNIVSIVASIHALHSLLTDEQKMEYGNRFPNKYTQVEQEVRKHD